MNVEKQLQEFIKQFDVEVDLNIVVKGKRAYHVPAQVGAVVDKIKAEPYSQGVPLGEAGPKGFQPSFYLLDQLAATKKYVIVNDEAEWMFVCGRDIFEANVLKKENTRKLFLVKNRHNEIIGMGRWISQGEKHFVKPELERGDFLHRESKRKKKKRPQKK